jgi:hypothetical protein
MGGHSIVRAIVRLGPSRRRASGPGAVGWPLYGDAAAAHACASQPPAAPLRRVPRLQGSISAGKIRHYVRLATNFRHPGHSIVLGASSLSGCGACGGKVAGCRHDVGALSVDMQVAV